jgi:hypothetical protein
MTDALRDRTLVAWVVVAIATTTIALLRVEPVAGLLGPRATTLGPMVATLGLVAQLMHSTRVAFVVRLAALATILAALSDPAPNAPDQLAAVISPVWTTVTSAVGSVARIAFVGLAIGAVLWVVASPSSSARPGQPAAKQVVTGSSIGPVTAAILRAFLRFGSALLAALMWLLIGGLAWLLAGRHGIALASDRATPDGMVDRAIAASGRIPLQLWRSSGGLLGRISEGWGRRQEHGVWLEPVALARDAEGEISESREWVPRTAESDAEHELRELAGALVAAYDVAMQERPSGRGGQPGHDPRSAPPPRPYRLIAARAWSRAEYHAVILRAEPAWAANAIGKVTLDQIVPSLDTLSSWTTDDLRRLRISDPRVATDPLRAAEPGLFLAFDRDGAEALEPTAADDIGRRAIDRALREAGLAGRFRFEGSDQGFDADVYEYRASFRTAGEWRELEAGWRSIQPAAALFARNEGIRMDTKLEPYAFTATISKPTPKFPSGEDVAYENVVARHRARLQQDLLRFIIGIDHAGDPQFLELGTETPHALIAGATGSGKSRSAVFSPLAQLMQFHPPHRLRISLLDSVKRELTALFGQAGHIERAVIADDGDKVVATIEAYVAEMDQRYRQLEGRERDPRALPDHLLVVEEWSDLRDLLDKDQLERVVRACNRIGQLGRSAGFYLMLVTQKASAEVIPPRLKTNFKLRIAGFLPSASDYGILFDQHRRLLPNIKGRLAIWAGDAEVRVVQGLFIGNDAIATIVEGTKGRIPPHIEPFLRQPPPEEDDELIPRRPTPGEIEALEPITVARILYRWQSEERTPVVASVRGTIDRVLWLGYRTAGRVERYTDVLADLERAGILRRTSSAPLAPRMLTTLAWPDAKAKLEARQDDLSDA